MNTSPSTKLKWSKPTWTHHGIMNMFAILGMSTNEYLPIHQTEVIKANLNPSWHNEYVWYFRYEHERVPPHPPNGSDQSQPEPIMATIQPTRLLPLQRRPPATNQNRMFRLGCGFEWFHWSVWGHAGRTADTRYILVLLLVVVLYTTNKQEIFLMQLGNCLLS